MLYQNNSSSSLTIKQPTKSITNNESNKIIKNLLLNGWRNRWLAPKFATHLKEQLQIVTISGDHYELSKLILQQATVGRQPVILFIDYLHHLLSCGVISFGSVINSIIDTCKKENTQIVICLLDFLLTQETNINCFSSEQDCLNLATSLANLVKFIFNCLEFSLQRLNELNNRSFNNQLNQHEQAIEKCTKLLAIFNHNQLLISLIYVGLIEENQVKNLKTINFIDVHDQLDKLCSKPHDNKSLITSQRNLIAFLQSLQQFNPNLQTKNHLESELLFNQSKINQNEYMSKALVSLNTVVAFDAILIPKSPSTKLANQLYNIATSNHLEFSSICCELIKCTLINFADSLDLNAKEINDSNEIKFLNQFNSFERKQTNDKLSKESIKWASFFYFKIPLVLKSLKKLLKEKNSNQNLDLDKALTKLTNYIPLIELIDHKTDSDCLENLLIKLVKVQLIDEQFKRNLLKKKSEKIDYFNCNSNGKMEKNIFKNQIENTVMIQGYILITQIENTVSSTLSSLSPDYANKENMIHVMGKVITGNSIEIVLNAITYNGRLSEFVKKIILINSINNASTNNENAKQAALRGNIFDISFLILFYIVQEHGQEIILDCLEEDGVDLNSACNRNADDMEIDDKINEQQTNSLANSFFVKFCLDYLPENFEKVNYEEKFQKNTNSNKIDYLLGQFSNDQFDYQSISWNEVLLNSMGAFKELLQAYLNNHLKFIDLTVYLLNMIKRNYSISLLIALYSMNRMSTASLENKKKIMTVLNYITNISNFTSCFNQSDSFMYNREKYNVAVNLIRNLMKQQIAKTFLDNNQSKEESMTVNANEYSNNKHIELYGVLKSTFMNTIKKGWLNSNSVYCFDRILCIGGATWFMDKLIKLLLYDCENEHLFESVELIYGLSSLDMEQCCLALLNIVIPQYLVNYNDQEILTEPKLIALAKLLSTIIYSVLDVDLIANKESKNIFRSSVKRNNSYYIEDNFINYDGVLIKMNGNTNDNVNCTNGSANDNSNLNNNNNDNLHNTPAFYIKDSNLRIDKKNELIFSSISKILRLISSLLNKQKVSQRSNFCLILLEQLVYTYSTFDEDSKDFNSNLITNDIGQIISSGLNNNVQFILQYLPFDTVLNLVRIFSSKLSYNLLLSICNLKSTNSRMKTTKALCQLSRSVKFNQLID